MTFLGRRLADIQVLITPGRDHTWQVRCVDNEDVPLEGSVRLTIASAIPVVIQSEIVDGIATLSLPRATATQALVSRDVILDYLSDGDEVLAIAKGRTADA